MSCVPQKVYEGTYKDIKWAIEKTMNGSYFGNFILKCEVSDSDDEYINQHITSYQEYFYNYHSIIPDVGDDMFNIKSKIYKVIDYMLRRIN
jgi:hypothetical protein